MFTLPKSRRGQWSVLSLLRHRECSYQPLGCIDSVQHWLLRWMLTHLSPIPYALLASNAQTSESTHLSSLTRTTVECLEFDALGVLLAAGGYDGSISIFDFDIYFHQTLTFDQRATEAAEEETDVPRRIFPTEPIHVIHTGHPIRCIRWNPNNQDELACSFVNFNAIYLYNLSTLRTKPSRIIRLSNHPSIGYKEFTFIKTKSVINKRKSKAQLLATDDDGCIRLWELQRDSQRLLWIIKTGLRFLFTAFLVHERHLLCGTKNGIIAIHDIENLITPPFESLPVPRKIRSFNVIEAGKHLWHRHSAPTCVVKLTKLRNDFILCHYQNNWIAIINVIDWNIVQYFTDWIGTPYSDRNLNLQWKSPEYNTMATRVGFTAFDEAFYCMIFNDINDTSVLEVIDLCPPRNAQYGLNRAIQGESPVCDEYSREIKRLDRFRLPLDRAITRVIAHPTRHFLVGVSHTLKNLIIYDIERA